MLNIYLYHQRKQTKLKKEKKTKIDREKELEMDKFLLVKSPEK